MITGVILGEVLLRNATLLPQISQIGADNRSCRPSNWVYEKAKYFGNSAKRTFNNSYATAILDKTEPLAGLLSTKHVT
jgi:hypothetical protein